MAAMRVAIAGSNTLALQIANCIQQNTNYQFVILSRYDRPALTARRIPVLVVDYDDSDTLRHALMGVDVVISTVTGNPQVALIHAAAMQGVSKFAPAEFGSMPNTSGNQGQVDALDRGRSYAVQLLHHYKTHQGMQYTLFICGILYERFSPGGLHTHWLGLNVAASGEGDYIVNVRNMTTEAPMVNRDRELVELCLTAAQDVAQFVVEALGMRDWPVVLTMYGERMTVQHLVSVVESVRGTQMTQYVTHDMDTLRSELMLATANRDVRRQHRALNHIATGLGRFDFVDPSLNRRFRNVRPLRFRDWLANAWRAG